jgi:hypothetical protein
MMMKPQPDENPIREGVINRFYRKEEVMETRWDFDDEEGEIEVPTDIDVVWIDRLTDAEVLRYDGADPANRPPLGPSDADTLARKGLDINEEIAISLCKTPPTAADVAAYGWRQAQKVEKEQEIERGEELLGELDLFSYLEIAAESMTFGRDSFRDDEEKILRPAFERKGFTRVAFFMGEQDSFGPLTRGIRAWKGDKSYVFYYG